MRPLVFGRVQPARIPVDDERDLGDVAIVDAKGLDPLPARPLRERLEPLGEPAAEVADLVGGRARPRPAGVGCVGRFVGRAVGAGTVRGASRGQDSPMLGILAPIPAGGGCAEEVAARRLSPAFDLGLRRR